MNQETPPYSIQSGAVMRWIVNAFILTRRSTVIWLPWVLLSIAALALVAPYAYLKDIVMLYIITVCLLISAAYDNPAEKRRSSLYQFFWDNRWRFLGLLLLYGIFMGSITLFIYFESESVQVVTSLLPSPAEQGQPVPVTWDRYLQRTMIAASLGLIGFLVLIGVLCAVFVLPIFFLTKMGPLNSYLYSIKGCLKSGNNIGPISLIIICCIFGVILLTIIFRGLLTPVIIPFVVSLLYCIYREVFLGEFHHIE